MTDPYYDDAVVGAGIVGLAHAYHLARRGRRVVVFERGACARGASIRNFGMLWPIGQPAGELRDLALRSLAIWHELLDTAGFWHDRCGSLHLAYHEDEAQVLGEFAAQATTLDSPCQLLAPNDVKKRCHAVNAQGLKAGLWSPSETCVDPREVVGGLPNWLASMFDVRFEFATTVVGFERPRVRTSRGDWAAERLWICAGDDLQTLYPHVLQSPEIVCCKLQMMRSEPIPEGRRVGPMLAAGLTLRHYASFADCPTLPAVRKRIASEHPELDRYGIHVMVSQNGRGELLIGDSHEYGPDIGPFDKTEIDHLILEYLNSFLRIPGLKIAECWHGRYMKAADNGWRISSPETGVIAVTALAGAGMTLSLGLAERVVQDLLE